MRSIARCSLGFTGAAILAWSLGASAQALASPPAAAPEDGKIVVRDDLHHPIELAHAARRIVSLCPPLTETVCALGECARLVATDRYSDWPASIRALPKAGGLDDPQIEQIVSLHPDLVLISSAQRITDRLHDFGIESFALDTQTYGNISHVVTVVGAILGVPERAAALNRRIEDEVRAIGAQAMARRHGRPGPSVYYEVDGGPYAAGPESFIGELLTRLGARNIVERDLGPFPKLNPEYVVRQNPDVIFTSPADVPRLAERPGWDRIRAVREKRICSFPMEIHETIVHAGPRIAEGMRAMADCLARVSP
ncbi:MAG TPA: helical backbone metal receptor [Steroidobacteraceae bacterium]|nr:helical backbone metal receptor [Steroidobacteraceae bacterium]